MNYNKKLTDLKIIIVAYCAERARVYTRVRKSTCYCSYIALDAFCIIIIAIASYCCHRQRHRRRRRRRHHHHHHHHHHRPSAPCCALPI